jgi:hypothetical protein
MNNQTYWCHHCSIEWDPESENLRKESKITVQDRNIEPAIATTPGIPNISIRHEPPDTIRTEQFFVQLLIPFHCP